jgi:hypothetical protein
VQVIEAAKAIEVVLGIEVVPDSKAVLDILVLSELWDGKAVPVIGAVLGSRVAWDIKVVLA